MSDAQRAFDVVVVGAGMVGCGVALALSERGMRVALVERNRIGEGTSANSFAWINATAKAAEESYHRLNASGLRRYRALVDQWGGDAVGVHACGMLEWADAADAARFSEMRARIDRLASWGYAVRLLTREQLVEREPKVAFGPEAQGLHAFEDAWLDVPRFLRFTVERLRANGSSVFEQCAARALVLDDEGTVRGLEVDGDRLHCAQVVIATGPDTPDVLGTLTGFEAFATRFPMRRAPGLLVRTPATSDEARVIRHIIYAPDLHLRETSEGGLLLGSDDTDGWIVEDGSPQMMQRAARELLERTRSLIPRFEGAALLERCRLGVGVRAVPADGQSIAGPMPGAEGLHVVVTHSGVTLSLEIGELMAETIDSGRVASALAGFQLDRFPSFG